MRESQIVIKLIEEENGCGEGSVTPLSDPLNFERGREFSFHISDSLSTVYSIPSSLSLFTFNIFIISFSIKKRERERGIDRI